MSLNAHSLADLLNAPFTLLIACGIGKEIRLSVSFFPFQKDFTELKESHC